MSSSGWTTLRSSSSVGVVVVMRRSRPRRTGHHVDVVLHGQEGALVAQGQLLEDGVPARAGLRRGEHDTGEVVDGEPQVGGDDGQVVPAQRSDDLLEALLVLAQQRRERCTQAYLLAVVAVPVGE